MSLIFKRKNDSGTIRLTQELTNKCSSVRLGMKRGSSQGANIEHPRCQEPLHERLLPPYNFLSGGGGRCNITGVLVSKILVIK